MIDTLPFKRLLHNVAVIDLETFSLETNAVVYEFGLIITNVVPVTRPDHPNWQSFGVTKLESLIQDKQEDYALPLIFQTYQWFPHIGEQCVLGLSLDKETVDFHKKLDANFIETYTERQKVSISVKELHSKLKAALEQFSVKEIYANHPQFDLIITRNLFKTVGLNNPWKYNEEFDIATVRKVYQNSLGKGMADFSKLEKLPNVIHTALGDCLWNLHILGLGI